MLVDNCVSTIGNCWSTIAGRTVPDIKKMGCGALKNAVNTIGEDVLKGLMQAACNGDVGETARLLEISYTTTAS